jgi:hypothetical protein
MPGRELDIRNFIAGGVRMKKFLVGLFALVFSAVAYAGADKCVKVKKEAACKKAKCAWDGKACAAAAAKAKAPAKSAAKTEAAPAAKAETAAPAEAAPAEEMPAEDAEDLEDM